MLFSVPALAVSTACDGGSTVPGYAATSVFAMPYASRVALMLRSR